ncbi:unnamed protein product [Acanthoscelides obtectus]|uniref:Ribosome biogenesis protein WDR12 homolog n=1 Tax=Acanthoscelides obtectus TaxID=200917 RepID=A0A9P0M3P9_ACAOB|nr:unnamed protein product [Acanthoscelides obtectus]CAK1644574.1 Ribosome biogenesis protein WDR12 homolog [Acanthoscelides obtectus]
MDDGKLQIRLLTKQESYAVTDAPLSVPQNVDTTTLNELLNGLLKEYKGEDFLKEKQFDFLVQNELLRLPLIEHLKEHNVSTECTVDVEYVERTPAPEPKDSLLHDDWVCNKFCCAHLILTGCYDNSVNIWTTRGRLVTSLRQHSDIVKAVRWLDVQRPESGFISVSHDRTGILWQYEAETNTAKPVVTLRGHERGIDSVAVSPNAQRIATGGWDTNLKIWSTGDDDSSGEPAQKRSRGSGSGPPVKTPIHTLKGHKETISSCQWIDNASICTASMDHTIKIWDTELCGIKNEAVGQKAFLDASWSDLTKTLLTASADRHVRLYDPRAQEGAVCKVTFTSHVMWVTSVKWSEYDEHLFVSGGYDAAVKLWDTRSPKAPLYDLAGHEGQVLKVDWTNRKYLVSGGSDNRVHIFKNKHSPGTV